MATFTGFATRASSISARMILELGPVPFTVVKSRPFSAAVFFARGLTKILSPEATDLTVPYAGAAVLAGAASYFEATGAVVGAPPATQSTNAGTSFYS